MWFFNSATLLPNQRNLSIWLSATPIYNSVNGSYQCVDNFSPTVFAPSSHTLMCNQTLSATSYVSVWRPISAAANALYICEWSHLQHVHAHLQCSPDLACK